MHSLLTFCLLVVKLCILGSLICMNCNFCIRFFLYLSLQSKWKHVSYYKLEMAIRSLSKSEGSTVQFTCLLHVLDNLLGLERPLKTHSKINTFKSFFLVEPGTDVKSGWWIRTIWNNSFRHSSINVPFNTFMGKKWLHNTVDFLACTCNLQSYYGISFQLVILVYISL